jgi:hypothetical protein
VRIIVVVRHSIFSIIIPLRLHNTFLPSESDQVAYTTLNMMQYIYSQGIYSDCSFKCSRVTVGILGYRADPANQCRSQNRAVSGKLLLLEPLLNDIKIDPEREGGGQ